MIEYSLYFAGHIEQLLVNHLDHFERLEAVDAVEETNLNNVELVFQKR